MSDRHVLLGRIVGVWGVGGWIKVHSYTEPRAAILDYDEWELRRGEGWRRATLVDGRSHGKGIVALLEGCEDRDAAQPLVGTEIAVRREQLPALEDGEYYWADLAGLAVETKQGVPLGRVDSLLETGANDVLVVIGDRERLIPYIPGEVVLEVDLPAQRLVVDWDPDF